MSYRIEWIVPDHLIGVYLEGLIPPSEVAEIATQTYEMMVECERHSSDLVHLIVDSTHASMSPLIRDYTRIPMNRSKNIGWTILTGTSVLMRMIISVFAALLPDVQFNSIGTNREALLYLSKRDFAIEAYLKQAHPSTD